LINFAKDFYRDTFVFGRQNIGWLFGLRQLDMLIALDCQLDMILHGKRYGLRLDTENVLIG